jgi:sugar lactone lactonase YvrE
VAFSPDGTQVLTGLADNSAKLWNAVTGAGIRTFSGHTSLVSSVAFSPDGTKVLTGSRDNTAKLWNAQTGAEIRTFTGHTNTVNAVAFSPDGSRVLTGAYWPDCTAKLWDAATGEVVRTFAGHTASVNAVAFSPDGTRILTGASKPDNTAKLWAVATGAELRAFAGHADIISSVAFSPDGSKALTGSWDDTAKLWTVTVAVPDVSGQTQTAAATTLIGAQLSVGTVTTQCSDTVADGLIISQIPPPATNADPGAAVALIVSTGPCPVPPSTEAELRAALTASFDTMDANGDGVVTYSEALTALPGLTVAVFNAVDADGNGQVSAEEAGVGASGCAGCAGCSGGKGAFTLDMVKKSLGDLFLAGLGLGVLSLLSRRWSL